MPSGKKERAGKGGVIPPKQYWFTKENQPSPGAKSKGQISRWGRLKLRDTILEEFAQGIELKDGTKMPGTQALILKLRNTLLTNDLNELNEVQAKLTLKLFEFAAAKERIYEAPPPDDGENDEAADAAALSFKDFCAMAGYPVPYPKQEEMAKFALEHGIKQLLGARNYGKTDYGVICGITHYLINNPNDTFLLITKEEERGKNIAGEMARILKKAGVPLDSDKAGEFNIAGHAGKDPTFAALPLRSKSFRGRHPKYIYCDDIITPDDCGAAERKRVKLVWNEIVKLSPNICVIGQPAHKLDLYADLRSESGVRKMELPYGDIPELDADLEAQRAAGVSEASIDASYFLKISESERLPFGGVKKADFFPRGGCAGFIDPSHEGKDYTAFALGAMNFENFIVLGFAWQRAWDDCLSEIRAVHEVLECKKFAFETNGLGKHPVRMLRQDGANVREWKSTDNKHGRILNAAMFRDHILLSTFIPAAIRTPALIKANEDFNKMVLEYEYKAEHDDAPDALANLMQYLGLVKK